MVKKILTSVAIAMIGVAYFLHWPSWVEVAFMIIALVLIFLPTSTKK